MKLYLVQHGEAKSREEDPSRPLTDKGKSEVEKVAKYAARIGLKVNRIFHSGKLRALQTAEILAKYLKPTHGIEKADSLDPLANPKIWADRLKEIDENLMLVGHLPHLSKLASLLLTGNADIEPIKFRMGGIVCLERINRENWKLIWIITPELIL